MPSCFKVWVCALLGKKEGSHYLGSIFSLPWTRPLQFTESLVVKARSHSVPFLACNRVDTDREKRATYCAALGENSDKPLGLLTLFQTFIPLGVDAKFCDEKGNIASFGTLFLWKCIFLFLEWTPRTKRHFGWVRLHVCHCEMKLGWLF